MYVRLLALPLLAFVSLPVPTARAQGTCVPTDTPRQCFLRAMPVPEGSTAAAAVAPAAQAVQASVATFNSGAADLSGPIRSTLKDFLSVLSSSLDSPVLGDDGTRLTFGYNLPVTLLGASRQVRLETEFVEPQLSELTKTTLAADPAALAAAEQSLSTLDDFTAGLTFAPSTPRFGRRIEPHRTLFASMFLASAFASQADAQNALAQALVQGGVAAADIDRPFRELVADPATAGAVAAAFEAAARAAVPPPVSGGFSDRFAQLLNNQPQLYATASHRFRRDVAGPREWAVRVAWEIGSRNLNGFYRNEGRDCGAHSSAPEDAARCATALDEYMRRATGVLSADRLELSLTYRDTEHIAAQAVVPTRTLEYEVAYGRPFASFVPGREGRIELRWKFAGSTSTGTITTAPNALAATRLPEEDELTFRPQREKSTAAVTYTQKISDRLSLPVSVVYTEREAFLPSDPDRVSPPLPVREVVLPQERLAVHVGLLYRIVPPRPGARPCCCC